MASEVKSDKLSPSTGTALQIGDASDTITIPTGATFTVTDGIGVASGGTGLASFTAGDILYATGSTTLAKLAKGTAEQVLAMNSGATAPDWGSVDLTVLPTITVAKGGTNLSSFTAGDVLYATGSTTLAKLAKGSAADVLTMNTGATAPEWAAAAGGGKIGQVVSTTLTDTEAYATQAWADIAGLTLDITPSAADSKILLMTDLQTSVTSGYDAGWKFLRDTTVIYIGDLSSPLYQASKSSSGHYNQQTVGYSGLFLDSPSTTSATTYKIQWFVENTATVYRGRAVSNPSAVYYGRTADTLTAMEVLA